MFSVGQILLWSSGKVVNQEEIEALQDKIAVKRMAPLVGASGSDLCFFFSKQYQMELFQTRPGILVTGLSFVQPIRAAKLPLWKTAVVIACEDPYLAMAKISAKFAERAAEEELGSWSDRIHPSASVHPTARLAQGVSIGPNCVIERGVSIGENTKLIAGVFLGSGSSVGRESILFPNVTVYSGCQLGDRVRLHAGSVIGADGFGYAPEKEGSEIVHHEKIHHFGRVVIGNDVEVGALSAIDRGTLEDTVVEDLVKIDNFVQIAHNSRIGRGAVLCGCSGVAGGSTVGPFSYLGGRSTVINKAALGERVMVAADCVVTKDVPARTQVAGSPHRPLREHLRIQAHLSRMLKGDS